MAAYVEDTIMLFGDSITQGAFEPGGFGQRLSHVYARKLDVLNRGLSGYNTEWGIPVFEQCIAKHHSQPHVPKVRLLTIWFGANDACIKPSPQHVPLPQFIANLKHLIDMIRSPTSVYHSPSTRIILITPPPVNTHQRLADLASRSPPQALDRLFDTTKAYAEAVRSVGASYADAGDGSVCVLDVWTELWEAAGRDERALSRYLVDGLHLNGDGYEIMYNSLMDTILDKYPELHYNRLQYVFKPWSEIDRENPGPSLVKRSADADSDA